MLQVDSVAPLPIGRLASGARVTHDGATVLDVSAGPGASDATGGRPRGHRLTVTELAGTWDTFDPVDPARVIGVIKRLDPNDPFGLEGPFDAAFCDRFIL